MRNGFAEHLRFFTAPEYRRDRFLWLGFATLLFALILLQLAISSALTQ